MLLDKPEGVSSFQCLGRIKRVLGTRRVGHVGTLDPFASGLIGALTHRCTRLARLLSGLDKCYLATVRFGAETDTLDTEGRTIAAAPVPDFAPETLQRLLHRFSGRLRQEPPAFSAVHVGGQRAYAIARRGDRPVLPERTVTVHSVELVSWCAPDLTVKLTCSAGTYVRAWARDLGRAAASRAYLRALRRLTIGSFQVADAVPPERFAATDLVPPARLLPLLPNVACLRVRPEFRDRVVRGRPVGPHMLATPPPPAPHAEYWALFDDDQHLLALLQRLDGTAGAAASNAGNAGDGAAAAPAWRYAAVFADV